MSSLAGKFEMCDKAQHGSFIFYLIKLSLFPAFYYNAFHILSQTFLCCVFMERLFFFFFMSNSSTKWIQLWPTRVITEHKKNNQNKIYNSNDGNTE